MRPIALLAWVVGAVAAEPAFPERFADALPRGHTEVIYLCDLDRHGDDLLRWQPFRDMVAGWRLRRALEMNQPELAPQQWLANAQADVALLPQEAALSMPASGYAAAAWLPMALVAMHFGIGAEGLPVAERRAVCSPVQRALIAGLRAGSLPPVRVWLRFSAPMLPTLLLRRVRSLLPEGGQPGLISVADDRIAIDGTIGQVLAALDIDELRLRLELMNRGLLDGLDDPLAGDLIAAIYALPCPLEVRQHGPVLVLDVGHMPPSERTPLAERCRPGAGLLLYASGSPAAAALVCQELGRVAAAVPEGRVLAQTLARQPSPIVTHARQGFGAPWRGESSLQIVARAVAHGLDVDIDRIGAQPTPTLRDQSLATLVPARCGSWSMDATQTMHDPLRALLIERSGWLTSPANQRATPREVQQTLVVPGIVGLLPQWWERLAAGWGEASATRFLPGVVIVQDGSVTIERGFIRDVDLAGLPLPAMALAGRCADAAVELERWRALGTAPDGGPPMLVPADLGLGVPTLAVDLAVATGMRGAAGTYRPHLAAADGVLVFSTAPELTRRMLTLRTTGSRPQVEVPPDALAASRCTPAHVEQVQRDAARRLLVVADVLAAVPRPHNHQVHRYIWGMLVDFFCDAWVLVSDSAAHTTRDGATWRTRMTFRAPTAPPSLDMPSVP